MKKNIIIIMLMILLSGLWGFLQLTIFPFENFGFLYLITSIIGGGIIGIILSKFME